MPCARIWSTFWVMVAESDLPSNANTSAPYFSLAYFFASVNCPWWKTLLMSDTKKAIFFGVLPEAGSEAGASAAGASAAGACGAGVAAAPQADNTRLVSTSSANIVNRRLFI